MASRVPLYHNKPCVYYEVIHFKCDIRQKYSVCTHSGVLERLMFSGKSRLDRLRRRVNLANPWGRTRL